MSRKVRRRRSAHSAKTVRMLGAPGTMTLRMNPSRRRRRRRAGRRYYARGRRAHHRYRRGRYRRNPGNMLIDLAKDAIPVALSFLANGMFVNTIGPMIPGVTSLGSLQAPLLSIGGVFLANIGTQKVAALAKHRGQIMTGAMLAALRTVFKAFAPASIQTMVGMGEYVSMSDYVAVGATPLHENFTLSDYVAVGGDGLQEELGLEEELGVVEEALGNPLLGGMPGPTNGGLLKPVGTQAFLQPIPARSFTKAVPPAGTSYDNANQLYGGIFGGGFGH